MSGLVKAKNYDWKDSNLALFGSDVEKGVKKEAAETEPAWKECRDLIDNTEDTVIRVWRIEKFKVKAWSKEDYGKFYNGDSYIILHGEKDPDGEDIKVDVHFWIGKESTQDEYGTAAYKTVELDTYLDGYDATQHREVEGNESKKFKSYFENLNIIDGGVDSGFNHVDPEEFTLKKMVKHFYKVEVNGKVEWHVVEMPYSKENCKCDDGYVVIYSGDRMAQVKGLNAKNDSIVPFNNFMAGEKACYPKAQHDVYDSLEEYLKDQGSEFHEFVKKIIRVITDKDNSAKFVEVQCACGDEKLKASLLDPTDVFLLETPERLIVWIGDKCSPGEKQNALCYAQTYLSKYGQNKIAGISCCSESKANRLNEYCEATGEEYKAEGGRQASEKHKMHDSNKTEKFGQAKKGVKGPRKY